MSCDFERFPKSKNFTRIASPMGLIFLSTPSAKEQFLREILPN